MNNKTHTIYLFVILMSIKGLFAFDTSLNLPNFDEIIQSGAVGGKDMDNSGEIVVSFEKDRGVPKISNSGQVSVDFVNEEIKSVLRYVAELYDLNIIISLVKRSVVI